MALNIQPVYSRDADLQWSNVTIGTVGLTGNTNRFGAAANAVFSADATNGSYVEKVIFQPLGTNVASVGRIFLNNSQSSALHNNNVLLKEITLPAVTGSEVAQLDTQEVVLGMKVQASYKLLVGCGTATANGYAITVIAGKY
jgi:hypothetical protein